MPKPNMPNTSTRARRAKTTSRRDWKPEFLEALRSTGLVVHACRLAEVGRTTVYEARDADAVFAAEWAEIEEETTEAAERELYRRSVEGVEKPVFHQGEECGAVREYSDQLLIFLLKSRRPERYRDNIKVEHGGAIRHDLAAMTDDELAKLAGDLDAKRTRT